MKIITYAILTQQQQGFRKRKSSKDNFTVIKQLLDWKHKLKTHIGFMDFEKAFDWVWNCEILIDI